MVVDMAFSFLTGGSEGGYATKQRESQASANPNQMENDLELKKDSKQSTDKPTDVAGRESKGLGLADKLVPGK